MLNRVQTGAQIKLKPKANINFYGDIKNISVFSTSKSYFSSDDFYSPPSEDESEMNQQLVTHQLQNTIYQIKH